MIAAQVSMGSVVEATAAETFELPGANLSDHDPAIAIEVQPREHGEFTCATCYLIHHPA